MKCKLEKRYFLDPDRVQERLDELYADILSFTDNGQIDERKIAHSLGYFSAHIERDTEEYDVAVEDHEK